MAELEMEYGPRFGADTGTEIPWMGAGATMVGQDVWGKYFEAVRRGYVFFVSCAATALGTAFSTAPPLILWNPPNSGRNLSILRSAVAVTTAQTTINAIAYGFLTSQATQPATGALVEVPALLGSNGQPVGQAFGGATIVAPTMLCGAFQLSSGGTASSALTTQVWDTIDGAIVVGPGALLAMQGITAAGNGSGILTLCWAEVPILPG